MQKFVYEYATKVYFGEGAAKEHLAENGILKVGRVTDFQAHQMEHQLGAYTDCNHGQGPAVLIL